MGVSTSPKRASWKLWGMLALLLLVGHSFAFAFDTYLTLSTLKSSHVIRQLPLKTMAVGRTFSLLLELDGGDPRALTR